MFPSVLLSNSASLSEEATVFSSTRVQDFGSLNPMVSSAINDNSPHQQPQKIKKKRNLPGNPDPDAEVIALSPTTLLATNRFLCEICNKGFQRDQNLQLHRRGHNLPWKLKQRNNKEVIRKRAYVCPEPTCVHHHPSRALGDLTGIKKHFCRKHGEKKWKCEKCSKIYAVQSDWKAHSKTCGTREYRCDCGTLFSRKDSFVTHRAFCDALAEESARVLHSSSANHLEILTTAPPPQTPPPHPISATHQLPPFHLHPQNPPPPPPPVIPFSAQNHHTHFLNPWDPTPNPNPNNLHHQNPLHMIKHESVHLPPPLSSSPFFQPPPPQNATSPHLSATALLQKAANIGAHPVGHVASTMMTGLDKFTGSGDLTAPEYMGFAAGNIAKWQKSDRLTRDFLGLTRECGGGGSSSGGGGSRNMLSFTGGVEYPTAYERESCSLVKAQGYGFAEPPSPPPETWG